MSRAAVRKQTNSSSKVRDNVFTPSSLDEEKRVIEVVAATETPVGRGVYKEVLLCTKKAIDATRLIGLPVIDSHDRSSVLAVLGQVTAYKIENRQLIATIKFADSERGRQAFDLVKSGMLNKVSVGYVIREFEETDVRKGAVLTATAWQPYELSLVSVPADHNATVRGASNMGRRTKPNANPDIEMDDEEELDNRNGGDETRAARFNDQLDDLVRSAVKAGLSATTVRAELDGIRSMSGARDVVFDLLADQSSRIQTRSFSGGRSEPDIAANDRVVDAIAVRLGAPSTDQSNPLRSRSLIEIGRNHLEGAGYSISGLSDNAIADAMMGDYRSLGLGTRSLGGGMHTTSDFSFLMDMGAGRALEARYNSTPTPLKILAARRDQPDFRKRSFIRPGEAPPLLKVQEDGEIKFGTFGEARTEIKLESYARAFSVTRQALINDDLGVFADFIRDFSDNVVDNEGNILFDLLSQNNFGGTKLLDGKNLFHADRSNLAALGGRIDVGSVSDARVAMRMQKNVNGTGTAGVVPAVLLVGPRLETEAEKFVAQINATAISDVNPFSGKLRVMVENRYDGPGWWMLGDPVSRPALMYGHLQGLEGPQLRSEEPFGRQGRAYSVEHDFGAGVLDPRAIYFNPGQ
ncbi:HK97 family phage prohead protease [Agrobacterium sp.]|uniref:phage major capsid protein n=1 Tax=Agrobacterium sp. TaxID=361 RepID=UPI0028A7FDD2